MTLTRYSYTIGKNQQNFHSYVYVFKQYGTKFKFSLLTYFLSPAPSDRDPQRLDWRTYLLRAWPFPRLFGYQTHFSFTVFVGGTHRLL